MSVVKVTVRYFAAARAAAGTDDEIVGVQAGTTLADLIDELSARDASLAKVLARCTFLCDGVAVRDSTMELDNLQTIDVLPPFAGG